MKYLVERDDLVHIADAIREKIGTTASVTINTMPEEIKNIPQLKIQTGRITASSNVYTIPTDFTPVGFKMNVTSYYIDGDQNAILIEDIDGVATCKYEYSTSHYAAELSDITETSDFDGLTQIDRISNFTGSSGGGLSTLFNDIIEYGQDPSYYYLLSDGTMLDDLYQNTTVEVPAVTDSNGNIITEATTTTTYLSKVYLSKLFGESVLATQMQVFGTTPTIVYNSDSAEITIPSSLHCPSMDYIIWGY